MKPTVAPTAKPTATPTAEPTSTPAVTPEPEPTPEATPRPTPIPAAPTPRPTPVAAAAVPAPVPTADKRLMRGSTGAEVKAIQNRLRVLGFMTGSADGSYGPITEQAVADLRTYMRSFTLLETQGVGLEEVLPENEGTDAVPPENAEETGATDQPENAEDADIPENAADSADFQAAPAPAPGKPGPYGTGEDAGEDPEAYADALPDENAAPLEVVDGEDPEEEFAEEEGIVDDAVRALLLGGEFRVYRETLRRGSSSPEVTRLQNRLNTLRYLYGGVDGQFGRKTESAVASFQKTNKLPQTGIADEETQRLLFSDSAKEAPIPANPYLLKVSVADQRVYAYSYDVSTGGYTKLVRTMKCSTGLKATPTPIGTYTSKGPVARWGYFPKWNVYAQYLFRITGGILFHSVLYNTSSESSLIQGSVSKLGSRASHGCVRLSVEDAKWIYNNCPAGTTVTVY